MAAVEQRGFRLARYELLVDNDQDNEHNDDYTFSEVQHAESRTATLETASGDGTHATGSVTSALSSNSSSRTRSGGRSGDRAGQPRALQTGKPRKSHGFIFKTADIRSQTATGVDRPGSSDNLSTWLPLRMKQDTVAVL